METQIELNTAEPRYLFGDMWKENETHKATLLSFVKKKSKDGKKELLYLRIKVFHEESGTMPEYYLSEWRCRSLDKGYIITVNSEYNLRKVGENFIFS